MHYQSAHFISNDHPMHVGYMLKTKQVLQSKSHNCADSENFIRTIVT